MKLEAPENPPPSSPQPKSGGEPLPYQPPAASHKNRNLAIALIVIIAVAAVAGVASLGLLRPPNQHPWLFKGAYATYSGESSVSGRNLSVTIGFQVLDFNSTHADLQLNYSVQVGTASFSNHTTTWIKINSPSFNSTFSNSNSTLVRTYDTTRLVTGTSVDCTAFVFKEGENANLTIYISKSVGFPVGFSISTSGFGGTVSYDLQLVRTNISGL